jgi:hypothetical protein
MVPPPGGWWVNTSATRHTNDCPIVPGLSETLHIIELQSFLLNSQILCEEVLYSVVLCGNLMV